MAYKYSYEYVKKQFEIRGYELISNEFKGVLSKLEYICPKHKDKGVQKITFSKLHSCGEGCMYCGYEKMAEKTKKVFDVNELKELCNKNDFEYVGHVSENGNNYIEFICNKCRDLGVQKMQYGNMKRKLKGCKFCKRQNLPEWYVLKELKEKAPNIELIGKYTKLSDKIKYKCLKHNYISKAPMTTLLDNRGCYYCGIEKMIEYHTLSLEECQKRISEKNKNIVILDYVNMKEKATFKCLKCNHIWKSSASYMISNGRMCPKCEKYYYGERKISEILNSWNIEFIPQYRFEDCKDKRSLPFDFYLPSNNICIEYQGQQHYKQVSNWNIQSTEKHDKIKKEYCKNNNINLICVPYWEFNNLEEYLKNKIKTA